MAVGLRLTFAGGTQEQYDAVHSGMGIDANPPAGLIFHSAGPTPHGWVVADVWDSRAAFDTFAQTQLQPELAKLGEAGFEGPPEINEFEVHHYTVGKE